MENIDFATLFQGFGTMMESGWLLSSARVFLIALGLLLIYLGWKGVLEPMVMIPMGLGMYGAQNETYIEGWEKKTSNLLIYKRLCKV